MSDLLSRFSAMLAAGVLLHAGVHLTASENSPNSPTFLLECRLGPGDVTQVQSILEVSGELKVNPDGKQVTKVPISAKGELQYVEKVLAEGSVIDGTPVVPTRSVRYYESSSASSRVGDKTLTSQLADDHRLMGVTVSSSEVTIAPFSRPLTREELDLVDIQANSLLLGRLLPGRETAVGDRWSHDDGLAAALFHLDVVTGNKLESTLVRVEAKTAFLELAGDVEGSVAGVASQLKVNAKYQFDLESRRITWLALSIREERAVGHAEPGFDVTARLRMLLTRAKAPAALNDAVEQLPPMTGAAANMLDFVSPAAGVRFLHSRDWKVMVDRHDVTILRLVERGDLIAQCNISRLPDAAPDKQLSVASFQADIRRVLDKNFGQFVDASEAKSERGVRILRTIVAGVAADLPIQWNYYHLTDSQGRQASLVFTMDAKLVERFAAADQTLIGSFEFTGSPERGKIPADAKTAVAPSRPVGTPR